MQNSLAPSRSCRCSRTFLLCVQVHSPREIIAKLNTTTNKTLALPATRDRFAAVGADVLGGTVAQLDHALKQELAKWTRVAKAANIKLD